MSRNISHSAGSLYFRIVFLLLPLLLAGFQRASASLPQLAPGENYLFGDDFDGGLSPDWHFIDSSPSGAQWSSGLDNPSPMNSGVLTNSKPTTQAVAQWDPVTLANTGDYVVMYMTARTPGVNLTGTFQVSLLCSSSRIDGNSFGYSSYPLASANGYTYSQAYNSNAVDIQQVVNNIATDLCVTSGTVVIGDGTVHSLILKVTRTATGIRYDATLNSVITTATDTAPSSYSFNTLRIDGGGSQVNIDKVQVGTTQPTNTFTFTLPHSYETSAGVFNGAGGLVRNLWKKKSFPAGSYTRSWNGLDDNSVPLPEGGYSVKVLYHNMDYTWEGVIGNTSRSFTGFTYRSLDTFRNISIDSSGNAFVSVGYGEGQPNLVRFNTTDPQSPFMGMAADQNVLWNYSATDGANFYLANIGTGWDANNSTFVIARKVSDGSPQAFSSGSNTKVGLTTYSAIDVSVTTTGTVDKVWTGDHKATGLAVQVSGTLLAVSHGGNGINNNGGGNDPQNEVRLFNKTTGQFLNKFAVSGAGNVAFAPNGDLWVISGSAASVIRYTGLPASPAVAASISGFSKPLAVAVHPSDNDVVLVADGGSSQQVKCYNRMGAQLWAPPLGQPGGYPVNGASVNTNKFWFFNYRENVESTFLAFQSDGSFWVGDEANYRALHYSSSDRSYLGQIAMVSGAGYSMTVDPNNSSRVFAENLEYSVDYSKPLVPGDPDPAVGGNGCWKLVNNWNAGLPGFPDYGGFTNVVTLSNGRTYGQIRHLVDPIGMYVCELTTSGTLRLTGTAPAFSNTIYNLYNNGDIRYVVTSGTANPYKQTLVKRTLTGFDASDNPLWSGTSAFASTPYAQGTGSNSYRTHLDPTITGGWGMSARIPITSSSTAVCFNTIASSYVYKDDSGNNVTVWASPNTHLGVVPVSGTDFLWKSCHGALAVQPDGLGTFTDLADQGNQAYGGHCAIGVFANGRNILCGYDGQYGYFSNQFMHFYDDGLFVGQFGVTTGKGLDKTTAYLSVPGFGGNIAMMSMVTSTTGVPYVYYSDESGHDGLHRWRMDGTVNEMSVSGTLSASGIWSGNADLGNAAAWPAVNLVANPGFESEASTYTLSGSSALGYTVSPVNWQVNSSDGTGAGAFYSAWMDITGGTSTSIFARSYPYHATIAKNSAYKVTPCQILSQLTSGTYNLSAWVVSSGGQTLARMYCKKTPLSSTFDYTVNIPTASVWTQITINNIVVTGGQAEIGFDVQGGSGQYIYIDDVSFIPYSSPVLTLPSNMTVLATGTNGAAVTFSVTANDTVDGALAPSFSALSGTTFPIGTTTVTASATDSGGLTSTGSFNVTVQRSFVWFKDQYGLTSPDPAADPNHTGVSNLAAYAFGVNPANPDSSQLPHVGLQSGCLQITYPKWIDAGDLAYVVEVSNDLQHWNSGTGYTRQVSVTPINATREWVVDQDLTPTSNALKRFIRVRIMH